MGEDGRGVEAVIDGWYELKLRLETAVLQGDEPEDLVDEYRCDVTFERESGPAAPAAKCVAYRVRVSDALDGGVWVAGVFDGHSAELSGYHDVLFGDDGEFSPKIAGGGEIYHPDVLVLDLLEVLPGHRGKGLGIALAYRLIELLGVGCGLVACRPFPMQFNPDYEEDPGFRSAMRFEAMSRDRAFAQRKVRSRFRRLGFERVGRSDVYTLNLALKRPRLLDVVEEAPLWELPWPADGEGLHGDGLAERPRI